MYYVLLFFPLKLLAINQRLCVQLTNQNQDLQRAMQSLF